MLENSQRFFFSYQLRKRGWRVPDIRRVFFTIFWNFFFRDQLSKRAWRVPDIRRNRISAIPPPPKPPPPPSGQLFPFFFPYPLSKRGWRVPDIRRNHFRNSICVVKSELVPFLRLLNRLRLPQVSYFHFFTFEITFEIQFLWLKSELVPFLRLLNRLCLPQVS